MFTTPAQSSSFQDIFSLYLDLNLLEIDQAEEIASFIVEKKHQHIITYHRLGFVFFYFDQFVRGKISQEQFLTLGDVEGLAPDQINIHRYREERPVAIDSLTPELVQSWTVEDLVILDELLVSYYRGNHGEITTKAKVFVV